MPPLRPAGKTYTPSTSGDTDDDGASAASSATASSGDGSAPPKHLRATGTARRVWHEVKSGLNFYRLHLLVFTFTPLIVAAIFYGANGKNQIPFIDCLFLCVSAMTVTGLATVDLSTLTGFQQATLFVLMLVGSPVSVSLVTITVRRHFFQLKFKHIVASERERQRRRKLSFGTSSASEAGGGAGSGSRLRRPSFLSVKGARERFRGSTAGAAAEPTTTASSATAVDPTREPSADGWAGAELPSRRSTIWSTLRSSVGLGPRGASSSSSSNSADLERFTSAHAARKDAEKHERGRRARLEQEFGKGRIGGFGGYNATSDVGDDGGRGGGRPLALGRPGGAFGEKRANSVGPPAGGFKTSMIRRVEGEVPMLVNMAGQRGGIAVERVPTPRATPVTGSSDEDSDADDGGERAGEDRDRRPSHQGERVTTPDELTERGDDSSHRGNSASDAAPARLPSAPAAPAQTSITIVPAEVPRRGSAQTDSALSASGAAAAHAAAADNFPRSKTIAFDPDQVATHEHHAPQPLPQPAVGSIAAGMATATATATGPGFPRTGTIEFRPAAVDGGTGEGIGRRHPSVAGGTAFERTNTRRSEMTRGGTSSAGGFPRSATLRTTGGGRPRTKDSGFGGFPMPHELVRSAVHYFFPSFERSVTRNLTFQRTGTFSRPAGLAMNRTATMASGRSYTGTINPAGSGAPVPVPYISFDAVVGRNSRFRDLTSEQMEELGGVEYRALKVLLWIVPCYILFMQISGWVIFWPYIDAGGRYDAVFESQPRFVPIGWFAAFQSVSAFSNTGMSLVDQSMLPFQTAYLMIYYMMLLILAGNTAFPVFLRFTIWALSMLCPATSRLHETCRFLLDHPRRCYLYLFPAHQTVFLLTVIFFMTMVDWVSFLVLDIGTPTIESLPVGTRISAGFLQSAAVRAAGFAIVPLNSLAPAVKVLYALMMYVSVYPIAMSVRATNVYEERSLGMFEDDDEDSDDGEDEYKENIKEGKVAGWTRYLAFHARRQLAFDMWWLGLALWLICIIERGQINNLENETYFNIFAIIFELISGYGTVGLSLGITTENYSLSGAFNTLSKLVVIAVMIRGRHRGLPVAIDRAVMLPKELLEVDADVEEELRARQSRRSSMPSEAGRSDSRTRRDSSFSFSANNPGRAGRPSQLWFPSGESGAGESALSDDDDPPLPPQTQRAGLGAGRHPVGAPLAPVKELPSAAVSRHPSVEDLSALRD